MKYDFEKFRTWVVGLISKSKSNISYSTYVTSIELDGEIIESYVSIQSFVTKEYVEAEIIRQFVTNSSVIKYYLNMIKINNRIETIDKIFKK